MAPKRPRDDDAAASAKKQKKGGFSVGPTNLPDGTHKRKVQKIKKDLIHKAKLKKEYAKVKSREEPAGQKSVYERDIEANGAEEEHTESLPEPTLEPHPDRLRLLEKEAEAPEGDTPQDKPWRRQKRPRPQPFKNETEIARRKKEEAEARQKAREEAEREKQRKLAERERFRKAMAKARGNGTNGQRKLGRESNVLLEKVKRMVGGT